jgi:hypothetical protein
MIDLEPSESGVPELVPPKLVPLKLVPLNYLG